MKKTFLPFALFAVLCSSCCEDSGDLFWDIILPDVPPSVCDSTKATPYHDRFAAEGFLNIAQVADGSKVLLASSTALYWQDVSTGKLLRKIESKVAGKAFSNTDAVYRHGDLAVAASATGLAAFNVKTGELAWERALGDCDIDLGVYGVGGRYFVTRKIMAADGVSNHAVFAGDVSDRDHLDLLFTPVYSRTTHNWAGYGRITALSSFAGEDGHTYVLIAFMEPIPNSNAIANFMGLYDVTAHTWIYTRQPVAGRSANTWVSIQAMAITGSAAYFTLEDKLVEWNLTEGSVRDSFLLFSKYAPDSYAAARQLWVNDQYILVETTNGDLQAFDQISHTALYRAGAVSTIAFDLDRAFTSDGEFIHMYKISTGERLEIITAPCTGFTGTIAVWKDQGTVQVAAAGQAGYIYRYIFEL